MAKRYERMCGFCNKGEGEHYIYPLPEEYRTGLNVGMMACGACFPTVREAQLNEGILLTPSKPRIDTKKWKE